ncbi:MAG TPA: sigma-70 family RNA polymerase sigma factor [Gemmatimonadaceae bacterium]|jgi:RNA polymerase sigma factor for flagellar operon FliA
MGTAIAATIPTTLAEGGTAPDAVSQHLGLVYHVARSLIRSRGITIELDELVSAGTLGLIEALANFDASRGLAFTTFAAPRIRGAMLDELRRLDHVPRSVRRRARAVAAATDSLTSELGATPDDSQLASRLGIDRETLWRWQHDGEAARAMPFDHSQDGSDGNDVAEQGLESLRSDVHDALTREQELVALQTAIRALGSRERTVLALYYYEELRLHQIAEVLGVTESRVSQIRARAIARLREQLVSLREVTATARS